MRTNLLPEGYVYGMAAKMFVVAGPIIVFGVSAGAAASAIVSPCASAQPKQCIPASDKISTALGLSSSTSAINVF